MRFRFTLAALVACSACVAHAQAPLQVRLASKSTPAIATSPIAVARWQDTVVPPEPDLSAPTEHAFPPLGEDSALAPLPLHPEPTAPIAPVAPIAPIDVAPAELDRIEPLAIPGDREYVESNCPCGEPSCGANLPALDSCCPMPACNTCVTCPPRRRWYELLDCVGQTTGATLGEVLPDHSCGCCTDPWRLLPPLGACGDILAYGWANGGSLSNALGAGFSGPVGFADRNGLTLNQLYAVLERPLNTNMGWDIGGRVDVLWGSDYIFTESAGLERRPGGAAHWNGHADYGVALPQAYLEVGVDDLRMKLGHFYTLIGYESVMAPQNFFYSHAYTMMYGEPFTHTGMLLSYDLDDEIAVHGGLVNGWDRLDGASDHLSFLGGVNYAPIHGIYDIAFSIVTGHEPTVNGLNQSARTLYSLIFNLNLSDNLNYVLQHDHGWQDAYFTATGQDAEWYGINQYLFYDLNNSWTFGTRMEWFRDDDGARVTGNRPGNPYAGGSPGNFYEWALGLNYRSSNNLLVRPECRWDWYDGNGTRPFDFNRRSGQFTAGLDLILQF
ncbi:MAG: outer membrane beta-barrel protein [Planctomycetales bacterium]|nr:outer membrane beta-barrel protein [Planctomycetales bacterium]